MRQALLWLDLYASSEEKFYKSLGVECTGWQDEITMALAVLEVQMNSAERSRIERWQRLQATHKELTLKYEDDLARWKKNKSKKSKIKGNEFDADAAASV